MFGIREKQKIFGSFFSLSFQEEEEKERRGEERVHPIIVVLPAKEKVLMKSPPSTLSHI